MTDNKRRRWIINVILILALVGLLGTSLIPFLGAIPDQNTASSPSPTASAASQQADLQAQIKGYEAVLQREPDNQTALRGVLSSRMELIQQGSAEPKTVIAPLERLVKLNPTETRYSVLLAQAKEYEKDPEGAAQVYRNALAAKPGDPLALKGLVDLLLRQNRPEAAIGLLQDQLKDAKQGTAKPEGIDVIAIQVELGRVYATQKRYEEAVTLFDEAIKTDKQDFRPVLGKALVFKDQGKTDEAKALFASSAALAPAQYKDEINKLANEAPAPITSPVPAPGQPGGGASPAPSASPAPAN